MKSEWFKRWDDEEDVDDYWGKTKDKDDDEDYVGGSKGSWWSTFHGTSKKKSSYTPVKSTSAYLRSSSSTWWSAGFSSKSRSDRDDLLEILKEVNKTINLTQNSSDGKSETSLNVRYSNGHVGNDLTSSVLYVSPTIIRDENGSVFSKDSDDYYDGLDALNGQAMLCSFMKKSVSDVANNQYKSSLNWAARNIYMTDLQTTAGNEICQDWPGFRSYIEQQQKVFQTSKQEVLDSFNDPNQNIDNFINLLCYNRLSTDRINYRDYFDDNISSRLESADHYLNSTLDTPCHNDGRFERASEIFNTIQQMLNLEEPPPPPPPPPNDPQDQDENCGGSGGGESPDNDDEENSDDDENNKDKDSEGSGDKKDSGEGDDDDDDNDGGDAEANNGSGDIKVNNIDTNSNSGIERRFTGDNSYNGQNVENEDSKGHDIDPDEKVRDKTSVVSDSLENIQDRQLDNVYYKKIIPAVNDEDKDKYNTFVAKSRRIISAIKDCFQFHNTDVGMYSYGLSAGGIDENSMYKVYMGEYERLYERKDILARKKWLVSILIDQSGSMCDPCTTEDGRYSSQQEQASQLAVVFAEALKGLHDLDYSIYGFSTNGSEIDTFVYKDKEVNKLESLISAGSHQGTGMGFHIAHVGDKMISQYGDYDNKLLFVVTDGLPNCTPTSTMNGYEHTKYCCDLLRKRGIQVFGIGIANAFAKDIGNRLFGEGQFCVINDVAGTLKILVNRVKAFLQRKQK